MVKACLDKIDKAKEDIQAAKMDTALDEAALKAEITRLNGVINTELASLKGVKKALTDFFEDFKGNLDFNSSAPNEKLRVIMLRNCIKVTLEKKDPAMAALSMLHERELGAIFNYTSDRYKSFTANAAETAAADLATPLSSKATRFAGPIKATGISGLRKLPVYHKPLYRIGGKKPEAETAMRALALGKIGIVVNCGSFHSAAKSTGSDFIRSNFIDKNTLELITKVKTGHDIEHVSYFKGEQEVCFEPGAKFLIKSAQLLKDYTGTDANIIRMKQRDTIPNKYHILVEEEEQ